MVVLVTGGAGFIGSHLVERLLSMGYTVRVVDNLSSGSPGNLEHLKGSRGFELYIADLKDPWALSKIVGDVESVFHYAANPEVRVSTTDPEIHFRENVVATFNLLEAVRRSSSAREMVFASSSSVYGEAGPVPVDENSPARPVSVYGASKAACESMIHAYSSLYGLRAVVLRYANIVGPRLRHGVIYDFIAKLQRNREELEILGDGGQVRSYLHIDDALEATVTAWRRSGGGFEVYNVGNLDTLTIDEVASIVIETMGLGRVARRYKPHAHGIGWPGDVKRVVMRVDKIVGLGWRPRMGSREAVARTVKSMLSTSS